MAHEKSKFYNTQSSIINILPRHKSDNYKTSMHPHNYHAGVINNFSFKAQG